MPVDPEEGLVTDLMLGMMVVFGADIIALVGFMWVANYTSATVFIAVTASILAAFGLWIGWRWNEIRKLQSTDDPERTALDELKHQYAAGELGEAEFEQKLDRLVEVEEQVDSDEIEVEEQVDSDEIEVDEAIDRAE
jgi:Predicted membrane protein (DUF2078).